MVWVRKNEWRRVLLLVVLPFFLCSTSLLGLDMISVRQKQQQLQEQQQQDGEEEEHLQLQSLGQQSLAAGLAALTAVNLRQCFLKKPQCVISKPAEEEADCRWWPWKRQKELQSICIKPSARTKINHRAAAAAVQQRADSQALLGLTAANRFVRWWFNTSKTTRQKGYLEVVFDLHCQKAKVMKDDGTWGRLNTFQAAEVSWQQQ